MKVVHNEEGQIFAPHKKAGEVFNFGSDDQLIEAASKTLSGILKVQDVDYSVEDLSFMVVDNGNLKFDADLKSRFEVYLSESGKVADEVRIAYEFKMNNPEVYSILEDSAKEQVDKLADLMPKNPLLEGK